MPGSRQRTPGPATRTVVGVFGALAGLAGVEHGVGEIRQGQVPPEGLVIRSWPGHGAFEVLGGEPAMTLLPDLLASGVATVGVGTALLAWSVAGMQRRHGSRVLIVLSLLLLAVGGGFGPPLLGVILGIGALRPAVPFRPPGWTTRALARMWGWALGAGVMGYLGLVPGTLVLHGLWGSPPAAVLYGLIVLAFGGVFLALPAARASDRLRSFAQGATRRNSPDG